MRRLVVVAAATVLLLLPLACARNDPPSQPPTTQSTPSASPSPSAAPSSPSMREQQHTDLVAVQDAYKKAFVEGQRLLEQKDARKPKVTAILSETTSGGFRAIVLDSVAKTRQRGERMTVPGKLLGVSMGPWSPTKVTFYGCEDLSHAKWVEKDGTRAAHDPTKLRYVQRLVALERGGRWRIDDLVSTQVVRDFKTARCNGTWYS
jgi:hypothetical protein